MIGAIAVFLTATAAVALHETDNKLTPGEIGLALFSVFQVRIDPQTNLYINEDSRQERVEEKGMTPRHSFSFNTFLL